MQVTVTTEDGIPWKQTVRRTKRAPVSLELPLAAEGRTLTQVRLDIISRQPGHDTAEWAAFDRWRMKVRDREEYPTDSIQERLQELAGMIGDLRLITDAPPAGMDPDEYLKHYTRMQRLRGQRSALEDELRMRERLPRSGAGSLPAYDPLTDPFAQE